MAIKTDAVGKQWPPATYQASRAKIAEYAHAIGRRRTRSTSTARRPLAAGFRDVVAPPMFCVVYSAPAMGPAILDPDVGINLAAMVHGGQEFEWGEPVCSGDEITTTRAAAPRSTRRTARASTCSSPISTNQDGETIVRGTWTNIVRGV